MNKATLILLTLLTTAPVSSYAVSANYQSWMCNRADFNTDAFGGPKDILACLQEAFGSKDLTYDTVVADFGGMTERQYETLNRRLQLQGFPNSKFLDIKQINNEAHLLRMSDILHMLEVGWSEKYCR